MHLENQIVAKGSMEVCNPMRACERSRSPSAYGQAKQVLYDIGISCNTAIKFTAQNFCNVEVLHCLSDIR